MSRSQESLLVELRRRARLELERTCASIQEAMTSAIDEVIQNPSMSRSSKRSKLYKIKRNLETECEFRTRSFNRAYGLFNIHCLPEELMPEFSISTILSKDVNILSEPITMPSLELQPAVVLADTPTGFVSCMDIKPMESIQPVPVSLQPIVPIAQHTYDVLPTIAKRKISFTSYFRLTVLQTYEYLSRFGVGVIRSSSSCVDLPEENFPEVCAFMRTLRPCVLQGRLHAGVLVRSFHPFYNYRRPSGSMRHSYLANIGDILSDAAPSVEILQRDVTQFREMAKCLFDARQRGEDCIYTGSIYSGGLPRKLGGDQCILIHQLLWLKRNEHPERKYVGQCSLYHHGYFYDPGLGISYMTSSLTLILQKLELAVRNRTKYDDPPIVLSNPPG